MGVGKRGNRTRERKRRIRRHIIGDINREAIRGGNKRKYKGFYNREFKFEKVIQFIYGVKIS